MCGFATVCFTDLNSFPVTRLENGTYGSLTWRSSRQTFCGEQARNFDRYCLAKAFIVMSDDSIFTVADRWWGQVVYLLWCPVKQRTSKQPSTVCINGPKAKHLAHTKRLKHPFLCLNFDVIGICVSLPNIV